MSEEEQEEFGYTDFRYEDAEGNIIEEEISVELREYIDHLFALLHEAREEANMFAQSFDTVKILNNVLLSNNHSLKN